MLDNIDERKKKIIIFSLLILSLLILIGIWIYNSFFKNDNKKLYEYVTNYSRYYTVSNSISKYYSFINSKQYNSVLNILDKDYKLKNNISLDNIVEFIENYDTFISFKSGKMCERTISNGIVSYYVEGNTVSMNQGTFLYKHYYNVILDNNNITFSIKPINKKIFVGECHD